MTIILLDTARQELASLLDRARAGEEIMITDGKEPGVRLTVADGGRTYESPRIEGEAS